MLADRKCPGQRPFEKLLVVRLSSDADVRQGSHIVNGSITTRWRSGGRHVLRVDLHMRHAYLYAYVPLAHAEDADSLKAPEAVLSHEKVIEIPSADGNSVMLQATLDIPDGPGPFPLVVMNHGANGSVPPPDQPRYHLTFSAYYFLSRGYAVVLPMMRGYAGSQGHLVHHGCDYAATGIEDAQDIKAVIDYMKTQPTIDGSRIVVAGQSFGGWNTLAVGTMDVPGVRGLVSFAGGMNESDCGAAPRI